MGYGASRVHGVAGDVVSLTESSAQWGIRWRRLLISSFVTCAAWTCGRRSVHRGISGSAARIGPLGASPSAGIPGFLAASLAAAIPALPGVLAARAFVGFLGAPPETVGANAP